MYKRVSDEKPPEDSVVEVKTHDGRPPRLMGYSKGWWYDGECYGPVNPDDEWQLLEKSE